MKCWVLLVNRNRGKLFKKAKYEASSGEIHRGFRNSVGFFIPDESIPIEIEMRMKSIPLWVVNEKTASALTIVSHHSEGTSMKLKEGEIKELISLEEKTDVDAHTKLNLLTKREFWKQVAEKIKLSTMDTLIYLCAGYGAIRMIEYVLTLIFTKQPT